MTQTEYKMAIAALIDMLIREAIERDQSTDAILRSLGAESLELAARIHVQHGGCDRTFLGMAQDLLTAVRIGASEQ